MSPTIAVITVASGRHALSDQAAALALGDTRPDLYVVVALPEGRRRVDSADLTGPWRTLRADATPGEEEEPTALAHNVGAGEAISQGAELLVFLDEDVLPGPGLLAAFADVVPDRERHDLARMTDEELADLVEAAPPTLWGGMVADLPEVDAVGDYDLQALDRRAAVDVGAVRLKKGKTEEAVDITRFDSANVAVLAEDFLRCGGFPTVQVVGEDSALSEVAQRLGGTLCWVGGATAYRVHLKES